MNEQRPVDTSLPQNRNPVEPNRSTTLREIPGEVDPRFSSPGAQATAWSEVERVLSESGVYWLSTVRETGRPHSTPLAAIYHDRSFYFATGEQEQKARNLDHNRECTVTAGSSEFWSGIDVVIEGSATRITDSNTLAELATEFERKYQGFFGFTSGDGVIINRGGGEALVYGLDARKVFAFMRGESFSQTRWRFAETQS